MCSVREIGAAKIAAIFLLDNRKMFDLAFKYTSLILDKGFSAEIRALLPQFADSFIFF